MYTAIKDSIYRLLKPGDLLISTKRKMLEQSESSRAPEARKEGGHG